LVEPGRLCLGAGPKENHFRPAIDPLFRSAALAYGPRVIGVLLSGGQHDGSAGLMAIKDRGGLALIQDPEEARVPAMPRSALATVAADYCAPVTELGALLVRLTQEYVAEEATMSLQEDLLIENRIAQGENALKQGVLRLGGSSNVTCPECHGTLVRLKDVRLPRFRCHTGHAYSLDSLMDALHESVEAALWSSLRGLEEQQLVLQHLAAHVEAQDPAAAAQLRQELTTVQQRAQWVRQAVQASITPS
jgi:two-component system chemotaxis response regulator CheB